MKWTNLFAATLIPLSNPTGWENLKFSKITPNESQFQESGLTIKVNKSASPLVLPLKPPVKVSKFTVELEIEGEMNPAKVFPDDAYFRLGLVIPGDRKLGTMGSMFAPAWVKRLFQLAPKDSGIDKIIFYMLADPSAAAAGKKRILPKSKDLILEEVIAERPPGQRKFTFTHTLAQPKEAAALWLSTDGDNTGSSFTVLVKSIRLD